MVCFNIEAEGGGVAHFCSARTRVEQSIVVQLFHYIIILELGSNNSSFALKFEHHSTLKEVPRHYLARIQHVNKTGFLVWLPAKPVSDPSQALC